MKRKYKKQNVTKQCLNCRKSVRKKLLNALKSHSTRTDVNNDNN